MNNEKLYILSFLYLFEQRWKKSHIVSLNEHIENISRRKVQEHVLFRSSVSLLHPLFDAFHLSGAFIIRRLTVTMVDDDCEHTRQTFVESF